MNIDNILKAMSDVKGSDLHLKTGRPPLVRVDGEIRPFNIPPLTESQLHSLLDPIMPEDIKQSFIHTNEADFSYTLPNVARFRINMFKQRNFIGAVFRRIPLSPPSISELGLPETLSKLADKENGLVLVTGPTGSGKSTTLAAMISHINETRPVHILTIEDPIEFVYEDKLALINQRELGLDTKTLDVALKSALRQDPDIILMGEMRDPETIKFAITAAETGHLVFATLHTNDSAQTIERILTTMPEEARDNIRTQLSETIRGIICQRLAKRKDNQGRVAVVEIMVVNEHIKQLIAENRLNIIPVAMHDGAYYGMQTFNQAIYDLTVRGLITEEEGFNVSDNPDDLNLAYRGITKGSVSLGGSKDSSQDSSQDSSSAAAPISSTPTPTPGIKLAPENSTNPTSLQSPPPAPPTPPSAIVDKPSRSW